jgi:hypothetical protein
MNITGHLVRSNGSHQDIQISLTNSVEEFNQAIGSRTFDMVSLNGGIDIVVDDEGAIVADPQLNVALTVIAHALGSKTAIFGDGVLVGSTEDGVTVSLSDEEKTTINEIFTRGVDKTIAADIADTLKLPEHPFDLVRIAGF